MFNRDSSIIFKEILLDASAQNPLGFQEGDFQPLFNKYQRNRQILINIISFCTYVLQLPTLFFLRRRRHSSFALSVRKFKWFRTPRLSNNTTSELK